MSDLNTDEMNGKRPFEERVFARFNALDSARQASESHQQEREIPAYETKPIWEQVLNEIAETRDELSKRLDRIEAIARENRADLRDLEDGLDKIERKPVQ